MNKTIEYYELEKDVFNDIFFSFNPQKDYNEWRRRILNKYRNKENIIKLFRLMTHLKQNKLHR